MGLWPGIGMGDLGINSWFYGRTTRGGQRGGGGSSVSTRRARNRRRPATVSLRAPGSGFLRVVLHSKKPKRFAEMARARHGTQKDKMSPGCLLVPKSKEMLME